MNIHRNILLIIGLSIFLLCDLSSTQAGNADPQTGYNSLYDNILEKGANNGRCNAIGVLGGVICGSTAAELVPPINPTITELCAAVGVVIELPYESCYAPVDCVVDEVDADFGAWIPEPGSIFVGCNRFKCATIIPEQYGGSCSYLPCPYGDPDPARVWVEFEHTDELCPTPP